jgi:hypothetical protein
MKKLLILLGVLVLSLGLVSTAMAETADTTVSGTIEQTISITTAPTSIALTLTAGATAASTAQTFTVNNNVAVNLTVKDAVYYPAGPSIGCMRRTTDGTVLGSASQVKGGDVVSYTNLNTEVTLKSNWAAGASNSIADLYVSQPVAWTDPPGNYSLTLRFTVSAAS